MHEGERAWLTQVVANLADDTVKLVYADWLQEREDDRAAFLRKFVAATRSMSADDFPEPREGYSEEWLELIGFRLLERTAREGFPELKEPLLKLARPALRMLPTAADITGGASKFGGRPDLPPGYAWPKGEECRATYNDDTEGVEALAGFLAQVNLAEIADTQAAKDLPKTGLLSFFCFQDGENDNPDVIGAKAVFFPDPTGFVGTDPPGALTRGNTEMPESRVAFAETLDVPEADGPWRGDLIAASDEASNAVLEHFRLLNRENFLGYARGWGGSDQTPSKLYRHLLSLENAQGCRLHIQISQANLAALNFGAIELVWVDFD